MQVICISRGSLSRGEELAAKLAEMLGWPCLSREDLIEQAIQEGITVGKLETAMLKPHLLDERLVVEKDYYQAFATQYLCERALEGNLVYHGRSGHLLLPGVSHVLRVRVVETKENRIKQVMARMGLAYDKAEGYVEAVDEDRRRWIRTFYGVDWEAHLQYDFVVNMEQMGMTNAASALVNIASLPDFKATPASTRAVQNLLLAARVRVALARDRRLHDVALKVTADGGEVLVSYLPRDASAAEAIPQVVEGVEGVEKLRCTMATTNILWVQEDYSTESETYDQIVKLARRWNAAVELLRFQHTGEDQPAEDQQDSTPATASEREVSYNGGIEDDEPEAAAEVDDGGAHRLHDRLALDGVAGGIHLACCSTNRLLERLDTQGKYSLVVLGQIFNSKGHAAQVRLSRELAGGITSRLKVPLVGVDELKKTYLFSRSQGLRLVAFLAAVAAILAIVLLNQGPIVSYLHTGKVVAAVAVFLIVPLFAFLYGTATHYLLKLVGIE